MYSNKKIIILTGKIGSGKSYLLNILKENTDTLCIDCDKEVEKIMTLKERKRLLKLKGIEYLQNKIYCILRNNILTDIYLTDYKVVAIEGINAFGLFSDITDVVIRFNVPEKIRKQRVLKRGDGLKKFNYFNQLQKE